MHDLKTVIALNKRVAETQPRLSVIHEALQYAANIAPTPHEERMYWEALRELDKIL